jgi:hypothetical protein
MKDMLVDSHPIQCSKQSWNTMLFTISYVYTHLLFMYLLLDLQVKYTAGLIRTVEFLASYLDLQTGNSCSSSGNF